MKKTVAIIGAVGNIGSPIALGLATAGYRVLLTDDIRNHPLRYMKLSWLEYTIKCKVPRADVEMGISRREASWEADLIIPAVPREEQAEVASRIKDVVTGKIIIIPGNPLDETHKALITAADNSAAEELALLLPYSKVVKVVSALFVARPEIHGVNGDVLVAGDDEGSVATVVQLVKDAGFHPYVAGMLAMTRTLEEGMSGGPDWLSNQTQ